MTRQLAPQEVARFLDGAAPGSVSFWGPAGVVVHRESLLPACRALKDSADYATDFLVAITGVDYVEYFEVVYHLLSLRHNHALVLKTRANGRESPSVPSVTPLWQGADLQEREVWDLMGVAFEGHPNMKRVLTWEGFPGHPLRKDHLGG